MKNLKYILFLILSVVALNSCLINNESDLDLNDDGVNLVTFERVVNNLTVTATGEEYIMQVPVKVVGPTLSELTSDITVTFTPAESSTAVYDDHYRFVSSTVTLSKSNNYLGFLEVVMMTEGNAAPMDGTPEFETYVAPVLEVEIAAAGDDKVVGSGKGGTFTLNFIPPNPYAGDYIAHLIYRHPNAGTYPDNIYVEEDNAKTLAAITGRKCETWFATWDTDICWITVNADNSVAFSVWSEWPYTVNLGDPYDATKVTHYDPDTGVIYLYYSYMGSGGYRIFWEVFTPVVK